MFGKNSNQSPANQLTAENPVAYFCAEYGITDALPIYSGGLGVLAGDIVQESAERDHPLVPIGLFYKRGYFHQLVDCGGQKESYQDIVPDQVPLELLKDSQGETILIEVPIQDRIVYAQVWGFKLANEHRLYLLDTDHWRNNESDRQITDQLYGGDQNKRIQQELVLAIGGSRLLEALNITPSIYHMNEGHSAFLAIELIRRHLVDNPEHSFDQALAAVKSRLVFTNHTLVPAGNDMFPHDLIRSYLGKYIYDAKINIDSILALAANNDKPDHFSVTMFAMRCSTLANAVSKLHGQKAKDIWPDYNLMPITNGVHLPAWVAPELQALWDTTIPDWRTKTDTANSWNNLRKLPEKELWQIHRELKGKMLDEVYNREGIRLDEEALTVVWARRFATYKRPDLLFSDLERLKKLVFDDDKPIQIIVAGKSHPADSQGKQIIEHIEYLSNYQLKRRAIFIDDYSINLAKLLVSGADVWLNTPVFGLEASGTSGMKASANGVIQFTVPDGWAYEVDWYGLGYTLPIEKAETEIYNLFENKIIPTYYRANNNNIPELWVSMMKETIINISPYFSSTRMVNQYIKDLYLPCLNK